MPDFERVLRDLEIEVAGNERRLAIKAFHLGLDRARKEIAVIFGIAAVVFVVLRLWA